MDRRKSIKALVVGSVSTGLLLEACNTGDKKTIVKDDTTVAANAHRMEEEILHDKKLAEVKFFTPHELATVTILADIIIPKDEVSGSASEAQVPDFIDFMMNDKPEHQVPVRGGLRWLDMTCLKRFDKSFIDCIAAQRIEIVDEIAYPQKVKTGYQQGVNFFSLMRNLTISGFYTTEMGFKDIGYMGNRPNQWNGVPDEVLKKHNLAYSDKELKECISYEKA